MFFTFYVVYITDNIYKSCYNVLLVYYIEYLLKIEADLKVPSGIILS